MLHDAAKVARSGFKRPATWVLVFGWSLAFCAGIANSVAFLSWDVYVANMSGATANVGIRVEGYHMGRDLTPVKLRRTVLTIVSFFLGAYCCGLLIDKNTVHLGGKALYGLALLGNSFLFIIATILSPHPVAVYFGAAACGLQNAMCTSHFGAVIRTTHVTGTLTDIGSTAGRLTMLFLRAGCKASRMNVLARAEVGVDARKLVVLLPLYMCFLFGSIAGAYMYGFFGDSAFLFPAGVTGSVGFVYVFFRQSLKEQIRKLERERLSKNLADVESALQRTHSFMNAMQHGSNTSNIVDLDAEVSHMLEVVHDVEACMGDLYTSRVQAPEEDLFPASRKQVRYATAHF